MLTNKNFKSAIINKVIHLLPSSCITFRHEMKHKHNPKAWLEDDYFFIHIPKSGGTSVAKGLGRKESGHFTFRTLSVKYPIIKNKNTYFFIARNPIERIISTYNYINGLHSKYGTSNLPEVVMSSDINDYVVRFLKNTSVNNHYFLRPFSQVIDGIENTELYAVNFDGLTENLSHFYDDVLNKEINLPHANKSEKNNSSLMSEESIEIIKSIYKEDFVIYNELLGKKYLRIPC